MAQGTLRPKATARTRNENKEAAKQQVRMAYEVSGIWLYRVYVCDPASLLAAIS